jgi:hypothetical protein
MIFLYLSIIATLYLVAGVHASRIKYGRDFDTYELVRDSDQARRRELEKKKKELSSTRHDEWCCLNYFELKQRGCDCDSRSKWYGICDEIVGIEAGGPFASPAEVSYWTVLGWPLYFIQSYISTPKPKYEVVQGEVIEPIVEDEPIDDLHGEIRKTWEDLEARALAEAKSTKHGNRKIDYYEVLDGAGNVIKFANDHQRWEYDLYGKKIK